MDAIDLDDAIVALIAINCKSEYEKDILLDYYGDIKVSELINEAFEG